MSQTKYKLPDDIKQQCLALVKGYKRRLELQKQRRDEILYSSHAFNVTPYVIIEDKKMVVLGAVLPRGNSTSDATYSKAQRLEALEHSTNAKSLKAVEQAKVTIGYNIQDDTIRGKLEKAIWLNCLGGRNNPYKVHDLPTIDKDLFYEYKRAFLYQIAINMEYL
jgi:hypothetical protein